MYACAYRQACKSSNYFGVCVITGRALRSRNEDEVKLEDGENKEMVMPRWLHGTSSNVICDAESRAGNTTLVRPWFLTAGRHTFNTTLNHLPNRSP